MFRNISYIIIIFFLTLPLKSEEIKNFPETIVAELLHLPSQEAINVASRPSFEGYELPYLAKSEKPENLQLSILDLDIRLLNNKFELWSRKLNKTVVKSTRLPTTL